MNAFSLERMHERTLRSLLGLAETSAEAGGIPFLEQGLAYRRKALACSRSGANSWNRAE